MHLRSTIIIGALLGQAIGASFAQSPNAAGNALAEKKKAFHAERLIVRFKDGVDEASKATVHGRAGTKSHKKFAKLGGVEVRTRGGNKSIEETIADYQASGLVEYAEPDFVFRVNATPNDPYYANGSMWHLHNTGQSGGVVDADMDAPEAWSYRSTSGTIVAVIDSGVRATHEDLAANMWKNPGEIAGNGKDDDGNGYVDDVYGINAITGTGNSNDDNGHGTHVAGTIGAVGNNGKGVTGVAWGVKIMACKFLASDGSGYTSDAIEAVNYARANGAKVLNNSWGGGGYSQALYDAFSHCRANGVMVVAAAGNESSNNDSVASYPANYALDNILSVAATTRTDALASFSNYGANSVELAAPGESIVSTSYASNTGYTTMSGTSMATPQVSGLLALLVSQYPNETYSQILTRALQCVDPLPSLANKTRTGGRINLLKALRPAQPSNDSIDGAAVATGDSFTVTGTNTLATKQLNEPAHAGNPGGASVWWAWKAPVSGTVSATTAGSSFNTLLGVYKAADPANPVMTGLTPIASNNDATGVTTSALSFTAAAGTTYFFAVDGSNGATGSVSLKVTGPIAGDVNNAFAAKIALTGNTFASSGANRNSTKEAGEPNHAGVVGGKSVWWKWTAPVTGYYVIDTTGSSFDTVLGVYTGTAVNALTKVASNDDNGTSMQSKVMFYAYAGRAYNIAVDGYNAASGDIRLNGHYR